MSEGEPPTSAPHLSLNDLPLELRRKIVEPFGLEDRRNARLVNRALEESVATSKWAHPDVSVTIDVRLQSVVKVRWGTVNKRPLRTNELPRWRYCERLTIDTVYLNGVVEDATMRSVNDFLGICSINDLTIFLHKGHELTMRINELIELATGRIELNVAMCEPTLAEYLSIPRPVNLDSVVKFDTITTSEEEDALLSLLQRGHRFLRLKIGLLSVETLLRVMRVSSSSLKVHLSSMASEVEVLTISSKGLNDLPVELKRLIIEPLGLEDRRSARLCNRALEDAVATSKWANPEVNVYIEMGDGGKVTLTLVWDNALKRTMHVGDLPRWRYCEMLNVEKLVIKKVSLDDERMQLANIFLNSCSFDHLRFHLSRGLRITPSYNELIVKARSSVELLPIGCELSLAEYVSIPRPVVVKAMQLRFPEITTSEDERLFLDLMRRKHMFSSFMRVDHMSARTVLKAEKIVSNSPTAYKFELLTAYCVGEEFVNLTASELVEESKTDAIRRKYRFEESEILLTKFSPPRDIASQAMFILKNKLYTLENARTARK